MIDIFSLIGAGSTLTLVGLCVTLARQNGEKLKDYIHRDVCHEAMNNVGTKIDNLKEDITEIKTDVKQLIRNGGVK